MNVRNKFKGKVGKTCVIGLIAIMGLTSLGSITTAASTSQLTSVIAETAAATSQAAADCKKKDTSDSDSEKDAPVSDKVLAYVDNAKIIASDNKYGYALNKNDRTMNPDVDCSSMVWYALTKSGLKGLGNTPFGTSTMDGPMKAAGFEKSKWDGKTSSLQIGDVLWVNQGGDHHTEIYVGGGKSVGARRDLDGSKGDSSGNEVSILDVSVVTPKPTHYYRLKDSEKPVNSTDENKATTAVADTSKASPITANGKAFVDRTVEAAYKVGKKYKIPYEVILGQSAQETGWGSSSLAQEHNAYFGIRPTKGSQGVVETGSNGSFVSYNSVEESFEDYGLFIHENSRYAKALKYPNNPHKYLHEVAYAGYCTDDGAGHTGEAAYPIYEERVWDLTKTIAAYISTLGKYEPSSEMSYDDADSDDDDDDMDECDASDSDDDDGDSVAEGGSVAGAAPTNTKDYTWLCKTDAKVCKEGDYGPFDWSTKGNYQCTWYAFTRLWLIHNHDMVALSGNGGQIASSLVGNKDWTVSDTPKPGDGVSQMGGALQGDTYYGHIAVVEEVKTTGGHWKIRISEGNYGPKGASGDWKGRYNSRWIDQSEFAGTGKIFFRKNSWK